MRCRYALAHTSCTHPLTGATPPASRAASPHQHLSVALCRARAACVAPPRRLSRPRLSTAASRHASSGPAQLRRAATAHTACAGTSDRPARPLLRHCPGGSRHAGPSRLRHALRSVRARESACGAQTALRVAPVNDGGTQCQQSAEGGGGGHVDVEFHVRPAPGPSRLRHALRSVRARESACGAQTARAQEGPGQRCGAA